MISCPVCLHDDFQGAIFCSNCGYQLIPENLIQERYDAKGTLQELEDSWVSLVLLDSGQILSDFSMDKITIGRTSDGQSLIPEIDLSEFEGYDKGVSRLHCTLERIGSSPTVVDLESSNGTFLNGLRLEANIGTPFKHGDVLSLGRFNIKLLLHFKEP